MVEVPGKYLLEQITSAMAVYKSIPKDKDEFRPVLIEAEDGLLTFSTIHSLQALSRLLGKKSPDFWSIIVPGQALQETAAKGKKGTVGLEVRQDQPGELRVLIGKGETLLQGHAPDEWAELRGAPFPRPDFPELGECVPGLREALERALRIAGGKDAMGAMKNVALQPVGDKTVVVGTDGFRLVATEVELKLERAVYLPAPELRFALVMDGDLRYVDSGEKYVYLGAGGAEIRLEHEDTHYPDWNRILPHHPYSLCFDSKALAGAVDRAMILSEKEHLTPIDIFPAREQAEMRAASTYGFSVEHLALVSAWDGVEDPPQVRFNGKFLKEALADHEGDEFRLSIGDSYQPCVIEDGSSRVLIVPLRERALN